MFTKLLCISIKLKVNFRKLYESVFHHHLLYLYANVYLIFFLIRGKLWLYHFLIEALESITINKASGGDGIPAEQFQFPNDVVKVVHSICQQI